MTTTVKIISTDFIPLIHSYKFVFIFYCLSKEGKPYNVEEFNTKTALCCKYGVRDMNFIDWNPQMFKGLDIEIKVRRWSRHKFIRFLVKDEPVARAHVPLYPVMDVKHLEPCG